MTNWQGFWSYVHADDSAEKGRVSSLARDIASQFEMMSGESISLFLDRDAIDWGDRWRQTIDSGLESVAFFVPVLTPRYFMSAECRRELQFFARKAKSIGLKELVLPLLYLDVPQLQSDSSTDDLVNLVRGFQWEDWRDLRFADVSSESYRRGVARLAGRLMEANRRALPAPEVSASVAVSPPTEYSSEEEPGVLDQLAAGEESLPRLTSTLDLIRQDIEKVGEVVATGNKEIAAADSHGKGYAARLFTARRTATRLADPVQRLETSANEYATNLHNVDQGFRLMINQAPTAIEQDENSREGICSFFGMILSMRDTAREAMSSIQGMIDSTSPIEKLSRDLRPILRRLRQALTIVVEAGEVIDEWARMVESSSVSCERYASGPSTSAS